MQPVARSSIESCVNLLPYYPARLDLVHAAAFLLCPSQCAPYTSSAEAAFAVIKPSRAYTHGTDARTIAADGAGVGASVGAGAAHVGDVVHRSSSDGGAARSGSAGSHAEAGQLLHPCARCGFMNAATAAAQYMQLCSAAPMHADAHLHAQLHPHGMAAGGADAAGWAVDGLMGGIGIGSHYDGGHRTSTVAAQQLDVDAAYGPGPYGGAPVGSGSGGDHDSGAGEVPGNGFSGYGGLHAAYAGSRFLLPSQLHAMHSDTEAGAHGFELAGLTSGGREAGLRSAHADGASDESDGSSSAGLDGDDAADAGEQVDSGGDRDGGAHASLSTGTVGRTRVETAAAEGGSRGSPGSSRSDSSDSSASGEEEVDELPSAGAASSGSHAAGLHSGGSRQLPPHLLHQQQFAPMEHPQQRAAHHVARAPAGPLAAPVLSSAGALQAGWSTTGMHVHGHGLHYGAQQQLPQAHASSRPIVMQTAQLPPQPPGAMQLQQRGLPSRPASATSSSGAALSAPARPLSGTGMQTQPPSSGGSGAAWHYASRPGSGAAAAAAASAQAVRPSSGAGLAYSRPGSAASQAALSASAAGRPLSASSAGVSSSASAGRHFGASPFAHASLGPAGPVPPPLLLLPRQLLQQRVAHGSASSSGAAGAAGALAWRSSSSTSIRPISATAASASATTGSTATTSASATAAAASSSGSSSGWALQLTPASMAASPAAAAATYSQGAAAASAAMPTPMLSNSAGGGHATPSTSATPTTMTMMATYGGGGAAAAGGAHDPAAHRAAPAVQPAAAAGRRRGAAGKTPAKSAAAAAAPGKLHPSADAIADAAAGAAR